MYQSVKSSDTSQSHIQRDLVCLLPLPVVFLQLGPFQSDEQQ